VPAGIIDGPCTREATLIGVHPMVVEGPTLCSPGEHGWCARRGAWRRSPGTRCLLAPSAAEKGQRHWRPPMSKIVGFIVGAALIAIGIATGNVGLIIEGAALIVTQAVVDLTMPKTPAREASEMSIALGEQPRVALFGEANTPGSLVDGFNYGGKYGTDWEVLVIRLADHKCESLTGFYVNDLYVAYTGDGLYPAFNTTIWRSISAPTRPLRRCRASSRPTARLDVGRRRRIGLRRHRRLSRRRTQEQASGLAGRPPALQLRRQGQALL
jgi:hypothetical protein